MTTPPRDRAESSIAASSHFARRTAFGMLSISRAAPLRAAPSSRALASRARSSAPRPASRPGSPARASSLDDMQVTLVSVKTTDPELFAAASLANATNSVEEADNLRFDCLQNLDDPSDFLLVEMYKTPAGPVAHKATRHYEAWRDAVADVMAEPRSARAFRPVYPWPGLWGTAAASRRRGPLDGEATAVDSDSDSDSNALARRFMTLDVVDGEKESVEGASAADPNPSPAALLDALGDDASGDAKVITHVHVRCVPGTESAFAEASVANAASSVLEPRNLRFDVLQDREDETRFLLVEAYENAEAPRRHKETPHYLEWRNAVEEMMAEPRRAVRYAARFPTEPEAWKMTLSDE